MLLYNTRLTKAPIISLQTGAKVGEASDAVIDSANLAIVAYYVSSPLFASRTKLLRTIDIRELSSSGIIIDSADELVGTDDIIKIKDLLERNFKLLGLQVLDLRRKAIGSVESYTIDTDRFMIQQIATKPSLFRRISTTGRLVHRSQIKEITPSAIVIDDADNRLTSLETKGNIHQSYANPFRKQPKPQLDPASSSRQTPD